MLLGIDDTLDTAGYNRERSFKANIGETNPCSQKKKMLWYHIYIYIVRV